ncbi:MAG: carboxylesterase family protein [Acidobacteria bacterium]|nr:carboxylesterase family protein [Acidobacteriota bacterium]
MVRGRRTVAGGRQPYRVYETDTASRHASNRQVRAREAVCAGYRSGKRPNEGGVDHGGRQRGRVGARGKTPVYNYLFAWEYPINGGITAFHCSELAFCFHALSVPQIRTATGGGPVAMALQDKVAGAWVSFAKTGSPSRPGLEWRPYTPDNPQAMVFDTISESRPLRDDKLVSLLPAGGGRGGRGAGRGSAPGDGRG